MAEAGITEKILVDAIARFAAADPDNAGVAELLRNGISTGKLQNHEWIANILLEPHCSAHTEESSDEAPES